jgi:hypothetical protein
LLLAVLAACSRTPTEAAETPARAADTTARSVPAGEPAASTPASMPAAPAVAAGPAATAAPSALPRLTVHKSPTCGCCSAWVGHMREAGFEVDVVETHDLESIRKAVGVPAGKASCHTAQVDGYFVEGHVPAADVMRLLRERPEAKGLTVPGMPIGSPGMEIPSGLVQPYSVLLVGDGGSTREYSRHGD